VGSNTKEKRMREGPLNCFDQRDTDFGNAAGNIMLTAKVVKLNTATDQKNAKSRNGIQEECHGEDV
jgi:hypothetical protein